MEGQGWVDEDEEAVISTDLDTFKNNCKLKKGRSCIPKILKN